MTPDGGVFDVGLERVLARLDEELAAHARAWAERGAPPPTPPALVDPSVRRALVRGAGQGDARAVALVPACWLAAIEADAAVSIARAATPSWDGLALVTAARADAALRLGASVPGTFGELVHAAAGIPATARAAIATAARGDVPPATARFRDDVVGLPAIDPASLGRAADALARAHGIATAGLRVAIGAEARTFVIAPGRDVRVVARAGASIARWAEALHELGHALVGLASAARPPRAVDEGIAAWTARAIEAPAFAHDALGVPVALAEQVAAIARAGRARQIAQRARLAAHEESLLAGARVPPPALGVTVARPPAALWLDPGAQLAYAAADVIADELAPLAAAGAPIFAPAV